MEVIEVKLPVNPKHYYKQIIKKTAESELYTEQFVKYSTMTSKYPHSVGGIWYFLDEVRKKCTELDYPGIFLYDIEEREDVPNNGRLEKSVYIRWDFIKTH